jgi:hypothetical protein
MPKVNSTAIKSVSPKLLGGIRVKFHNGGVYDYEGVSRVVYKSLRDSRSVGVTYNREIKGQFPVRKVR